MITTGIGDMAVYIPKLLMRLSRLLERYALSNPTIQRILEPRHRTHRPDLDAVSQLLGGCGDHGGTGGDATAVADEPQRHRQSALHRGGHRIRHRHGQADRRSRPAACCAPRASPIPDAIATFQTQHACAGGTYSLMGVNALLSLGSVAEERGLVICTDVARYDTGTSAEITQGAGAVAMIAERSCGLAELDLATAGYASRDVDDFFRPVGADTPRVRGAFSVHCYKETIEHAFLDHCKRAGYTPAEALEQTNLFAFHAPYRQLPLEMMILLVTKYLSLSPSEVERYLEQRDFDASIQPAAIVGNLYSGSLFSRPGGTARSPLPAPPGTDGRRTADAALLRVGQHRGGSRRPGGTARPRDNRTLGYRLRYQSRPRRRSRTDYDRWVSGNGLRLGRTRHACAASRRDAFYLQRIREDGYRVYALQR